MNRSSLSKQVPQVKPLVLKAMKEEEESPTKKSDRRESGSPIKFGQSMRSGRGSVVSKDFRKTPNENDGDGE